MNKYHNMASPDHVGYNLVVFGKSEILSECISHCLNLILPFKLKVETTYQKMF